MQYSLKINILVQDFCPLKIKITQFPDGFCLNLLPWGWVGGGLGKFT